MFCRNVWATERMAKTYSLLEDCKQEVLQIKSIKPSHLEVRFKLRVCQPYFIKGKNPTGAKEVGR